MRNFSIWPLQSEGMSLVLDDGPIRNGMVLVNAVVVDQNIRVLKVYSIAVMMDVVVLDDPCTGSWEPYPIGMGEDFVIGYNGIAVCGIYPDLVVEDPVMRDINIRVVQIYRGSQAIV